MFIKKLFMLCSLAAVGAVAMAKPATLTMVSQGTVTYGSLNGYEGVGTGDSFKLTTVATYDTDWITYDSAGFYREQHDGMMVTITLNVGDDAHVIQGTNYGFLGTRTYNYSGNDYLTVDTIVGDINSGYEYELSQSTAWNEGMYIAPLLLGKNVDISYAFPFSTSAILNERLASERVGQLFLEMTSTNIQVSVVPEPAVYITMLGGLGMFGAMALRRSRKLRACT